MLSIAGLDPWPEELLARQDERLLKPLGVSKADREALLAAWARLPSG